MNDEEKIIDPIITDRKILNQKSLPTTWEHIEEINLVERLKASNETAWTKGVGLAAIQIGLPIRALWFTDQGKDYVLVNPVFLKASGPIIVPKEGCLSIPDVWTATKRFNNVTVRFLGKEGSETVDFSGFPAIVVQHEIDHLNGMLNTERRYIPPQKVGRNDPCPCGSGKKYKKCCIDKLVQPTLKEERNDVDNNSGSGPTGGTAMENGRGGKEMGARNRITLPPGVNKIPHGGVLGPDGKLANPGVCTGPMGPSKPV